MLQGIGFFIRSLDDDELPAPQELVGPDARLNMVADYLDSGIVFARYRGFSWCRFACGESSTTGYRPASFRDARVGIGS